MKRTLIIIALITLASSGCVRSSLTIKSNPTGALLFIDGQLLGETPVTIDFDHYGHHEILLRLPTSVTSELKYAPKREVIEVSPPWYLLFPFDFFVDFFYPVPIHDHHEFSFDLDRFDPSDGRPAFEKRARSAGLDFGVSDRDEGEEEG